MILFTLMLSSKMLIYHCPGAVISVIAVYCNKVQQQETKPAVL